MDERPDRDLKLYLVMQSAIERMEALANGPSDPVTLPSGKLSTRAEVASDLASLRQRQMAQWNRITGYAQFVLIPSMLLLALGVMVSWAMRGFRKDNVL